MGLGLRRARRVTDYLPEVTYDVGLYERGGERRQRMEGARRAGSWAYVVLKHRTDLRVAVSFERVHMRHGHGTCTLRR